MKPTSSSSAGPRTLEIKLDVLDALCSGDDVVLMKLSYVPHSIPPPLDLFLHLLVIMRHPDALRYLSVSTPLMRRDSRHQTELLRFPLTVKHLQPFWTPDAASSWALSRVW